MTFVFMKTVKVFPTESGFICVAEEAELQTGSVQSTRL